MYAERKLPLLPELFHILPQFFLRKKVILVGSNLCCSDVDSFAAPSCFFLSSTDLNSICDWICKNPPLLHKTDISYTQEVSMHSVSAVQCELVCFSGEHFANPVMPQLREWQGINWVAMSWNCSHC